MKQVSNSISPFSLSFKKISHYFLCSSFNFSLSFLILIKSQLERTCGGPSLPNAKTNSVRVNSRRMVLVWLPQNTYTAIRIGEKMLHISCDVVLSKNECSIFQ